MPVRSSQWKKVSQEVASAALAYHAQGDTIEIRPNSFRALALFASRRSLVTDFETYLVRTCDPPEFHSYHFTLHPSKKVMTLDEAALELLG
jgi:hypothetical protein